MAAPLKIGMAPTHPGAFVREEVFDELRLSIERAAGILGVPPAALSDLVNGNARLPPEPALRTEKAFGVNMDTLLRMQAWYDAHTMRQRADEIDVPRFGPERSRQKRTHTIEKDSPTAPGERNPRRIPDA